MTNRTLSGFSLVTNTRLTRVTMTAVFVAAMLATSIGCGRQSNPTASNPLTLAPSSPPSPVSGDHCAGCEQR